jgi:hypothetical protein
LQTSLVTLACLSTCNNSSTATLIFIKFYIGAITTFLETLRYCLNSDSTIVYVSFIWFGNEHVIDMSL